MSPLVFASLLLLVAVAAILAHAVRRATRRARDLEARIAATEARLAAVRRARLQVIEAAAHELRTPLSAILGHQELMAEGLYGDMDERCAGAVQRIGDSSIQLLHLLDGVLDLARIELEALELHVTPADSEELLREAVRYARALGGERGGEVEATLPDSFPRLHTDARRAERLLNLAITGGVRATGGRPLALRARWQEGPRLVVELAGVDLPPDPPAGDLPPDPGRAALAELRASFPEPGIGEEARGGSEGTGRSWLRLTIARTLARRLGGVLRVEPSEGGAARIRVELPSLPWPASGATGTDAGTHPRAGAAPRA